MHPFKATAAAVALAFGAAPVALAQSGAEIQEIRQQIERIREEYEARLRALEERLRQAEAKAGQAEEQAAKAERQAAAVARRRAENVFNPGLSLILQGRYAHLRQDPETYRIDGFIPSGGEVGPGERGFSLTESELNLHANVDPYFRALFTAAYSPENQVEVEEAYFQTLSLPQGLTLKGGRFFSGIGYFNEQHHHAWDFIDAPLPYRAFLGRQLGNDGVQLKWVAPTPFFLALGGEAARSEAFPGSKRNKNGISLGTAFARIGGDAGPSHNWRLGLSYLQTSPQERAYGDQDSAGTPVVNAFSGRSTLWIADAVWKWAPEGNPTQRNFKFQAEYFRFQERGTLAFDVKGANLADRYDAQQHGWYAQAVYQFMPRWRVGVRYDRLAHDQMNIGQVLNGTLTAADFPILNPYNPELYTAMIDWSPTEFSRLRLQYARDKSRQGAPDDQIFLQYILSLGAHGAHKY
ncbi:carbohydrate porin [Pelomicrobium methylotrophicum]|uniref:Phosphate-selective porin O and P n=1 Tax=Pelomicrobium methylotrophicum TaxID=2602750 RepID=A0A5C7EQM0_9PROT|nr:carbohydrate porin [Pelomicrobium methylotrophicum]TXF13800.1 hypothetical protein FR698_01480 [Pelomicrobium methylotrophicum]